LPALRFTFDAPQPAAAILRTVEPPTSWSLPQTPVETLEEIYAEAGSLARELALASDEVTPPPVAPVKARSRAKRPRRRGAGKAP
jgi:hypothetical protein